MSPSQNSGRSGSTSRTRRNRPSGSASSGTCGRLESFGNTVTSTDDSPSSMLPEPSRPGTAASSVFFLRREVRSSGRHARASSSHGAPATSTRYATRQNVPGLYFTYWIRASLRSRAGATRPSASRNASGSSTVLSPGIAGSRLTKSASSGVSMGFLTAPFGGSALPFVRGGRRLRAGEQLLGQVPARAGGLCGGDLAQAASALIAVVRADRSHRPLPHLVVRMTRDDLGEKRHAHRLRHGADEPHRLAANRAAPV